MPSALSVERRAVLRHHTQSRMIMMMVATSMLLTLAGCMVGPNYKTPTIELPPHWSNLGEQGTADGTRIDLSQWWRSFDDPLLNEVIAQALSSNLDEKIALSRVREERASLVISRAGLFPTLDLDGSYTRQRYSANTPFGEFPQVLPREENIYEAGFDASWELDVFGGIRRGVEASQGRARRVDRELTRRTGNSAGRGRARLRGSARARAPPPDRQSKLARSK